MLLHNVRMCAPVSLLKALGSEIHKQIFIHIHLLSLPNYLDWPARIVKQQLKVGENNPLHSLSH